MKKIELLINEFSKIKQKNLFKLLFVEIFILLLVVGSFLTQIGSFQFNVIVSLLLVIIMLLILILYAKRQQTIQFCKENYQRQPSEVITRLENRKRHYADIFDSTNETLLFKEIIRTLKTNHLYRDENQFGPWEINYNHQKTQKFSKQLSNTKNVSVINIREDIEKLPDEIKQQLLKFGIDYHNIYNIWKKKIGASSDKHELMYPIFGMIVNDSQVLSHGLIHKYYDVEDVMIKVYETQIEKEDVVMIHVNVNF